MKGSNLRIKVKLTLEEIAGGVEKVKVFKQVQAEGAGYGDCQTCGGTGQIAVSRTILGQMQTARACPQCQGSGQSVKKRPSGSDEWGMVRKEAVVTIEIPAGVEDGMQLSVRGEGNGADGRRARRFARGHRGHPARNAPAQRQELALRLYIPFTTRSVRKRKCRWWEARQKSPSNRAPKAAASCDSAARDRRRQLRSRRFAREYQRLDAQKLSSEERELLEQLRESKNFQPDANHRKRASSTRCGICSLDG